MNHHILLSIILPVYNVEHLVKKCVASLITNLSHIEDKNTVEIIFVNDGSKDNSVQSILEADWNGFNPIIINQENQGQSAARNRGTIAAKGKYIWYIDSDDWIEDNAVNIVLAYCKENDADIFSIGFTHIKENGEVLYKSMPVAADKPYKILDKGFSSLVWRFVIRRSFLIDNNILFIEGVYHEDVEFLVKAMYKASSIVAIPQYLYFYLKREGSTTMNKFYNPKRADDIFVVARSLHAFKKEGYEKDEPWRISFMISRTITSIVKDIPNMEKPTLAKVKGLFVQNKNLIQHFFVSKEFKYKMLGFFLSVFPRYYITFLSRLK